MLFESFKKCVRVFLILSLLLVAVPSLSVKAQAGQDLYVAEWSTPAAAVSTSGRPFVLLDGATYHMWYGVDSGDTLYHTTSANPASFAAGSAVAFSGGTPLEQTSVAVIKESGVFYLVAYGASNQEFAIYTSPDGQNWTYAGDIFDGTGLGTYYSSGYSKLDAPYFMADEGTYKLYFQVKESGTDPEYRLFAAESGAMTLAAMADGDSDNDFTIGNGGNPILSLGAPGEWDDMRTFHPMVVKANGSYFLWYSAYGDADRKMKFGFATSTDGFAFTKSPGNPILEGAGAIGEPSVLYNGTAWELWYLTGTAINYVNADLPFEFGAIQDAVDAASAGDTIHISAGTFEENVTVDKQLVLIGAGSDPAGTVVTTPSSFDNKEGVFQIAASGTSGAWIVLQDLRVEPVGQAGISIGRFYETTGTQVSYLSLSNVFVIGTNTNPSTEQERGLYVDNTSTLDYLSIEDSAFNNLTYGWYFQKAVSADTSTVSNVSVTNTTFNHNNHKGLYAEKLTDADFVDCTFDQNGFDASVLPSYFQPWSAGVDINLKAGTYQNIHFYNPVVTNNATGGAREGAGMMFKARDDGASYGSFPATLTHVLVTGGTITGNERGIFFGEPGKDNAGPSDIEVSYTVFENNIPAYTGGDAVADYGALINMTASGNVITAVKNYWGHGSGPDTSAMTVGDPNPHGGSAQGEAAVGEMTVIPWYASATTTPTREFVETVHNPVIAYSDTIQGAVDAALDGDAITAAAGTYVEQVMIDKDLTITGDGPTTIIESPDSLDICWSTSYDYHGVVCILDTDSVTLEDLKIDGKGNGNGDYRFVGVGLRNAGAILDTLEITGIRDTPFGGAQHGVAINGYNTDGVTRTISVQNCTIDDFQKNAMALNANETTPLVVDVQNNTITGAGPTDVTAQNGVQVWAAEADGIIANNTISGIGYTGSGWVASSVLIYQNYFGTLLIDNNTITGAQAAIYNYDGSSIISNNTIEVSLMGDASYAIFATDPPSPAPAPFGEDEAFETPENLNRAAITVDITDNIITQTGADKTETYGVYAIAGWTRYDLALTITGNRFSAFDYSIVLYQSTSDSGTFASAEVHQNCINDSGSFGLWSNADYLVVEAESNWWGHWFGPFHPTENPRGEGGEVSDGVAFSPWLDACGGNPVSSFLFMPLINR